jgi:predicted transcriptional regulator
MSNKVDVAFGLGDLEGSVMKALWEHGELSTPRVHELVGKPRGLAYTTILTTLQRLHRKGFVDRRPEGNLHIYFAALNWDEFAQHRGRILASSLTHLGFAGVTAFGAEAGRLDPSIVALLKHELEHEM